MPLGITEPRMQTTLVIRVVAGGLVVATAFGCATRIHLSRLRAASARPPVASIILITVTALITTLQFFDPVILAALRRNGDALRAGEWWRLVTPLFVQADGWIQCVANGLTALAFCPLAERFYGKRMLALYFIPGLVGEIVGYIQNSAGAGSSVGIAGVVGGLFAFAGRRHAEDAGTFRLALAGLCGALVLSLCADRHGPPVIAGALIAGMMKPLPSGDSAPTH